MKLEILTYPNPKLRTQSAEVQAVTPVLKELADNMLETMYAADGIGLAAIQVGEPISLLVVDTRSRDENGEINLEKMTTLEQAVPQPIVIFNPRISESKDKTTYDEGCLSVPGFFETVERAQYIEMQGLDRDGKEIVIKTDGLLAICLQHELDHLKGKLFIDRISFLKSSRIKTRIKKHGYPTPEEIEHERQERRAAKKTHDL